MNSLPSNADLTQSTQAPPTLNALFHGGPWDGKRRLVDPGQKYIRVANPDRRPLPIVCPGDITADVTLDIVCYERRMFRNENHVWYEYFLEGEASR